MRRPARLNGLYLTDGIQHIDNQTSIEHIAPNCPSHELYKGVLDGHSHGVFNGKVYVHPEAQKTDGKQSNNNLLLSPTARVDTKPQLEIFADDVKCTHGATVGRLDEVAMFYLNSRGIGPETARMLLTYAFAADVLETIELQPMKEELERMVLARFGRFHLATRAQAVAGTPSLSAEQVENHDNHHDRHDDHVRRHSARRIGIEITGENRVLDGVAAGVDVLLAPRGAGRLDHRYAERKTLGSESEDGRADFDLVAFGQGAGLCERHSVDGGRINTTRMQNELAILRSQLGVIARHGGLANENMACGVAPDRQKRIPDRIGASLELVYEVGAVVARGL